MPKMFPFIYYSTLAAALIVCKDLPLVQATLTTTVYGLNYTTLPEVLLDISLITTKLTINTTSIDHLDFDALRLYAPQLKILTVIKNSKLRSIIGKVNSPALESLYLSDNNLSAYPEFESCPKLAVYYVKNNAQALPKLNITDILKCTKLWQIKLENVGLEYFPNFTQMNSSIRSIRISKGNFVNVDEGALQGLHGLTKLSLAYNYMNTIPSLRDLVSLEELSIYSCTVINKGAINLDWLYSMPNLRIVIITFTFTKPPDMKRMPPLNKFHIDFDASASVYLPADYLDTQPTLRHLWLRNVAMEKLLPQGPSRHLLTELSLVRCTIGNLTKDTFKGFDSLSNFLLQNTNVPDLPLLSDSYSTLVKFSFSWSNHLTSIPTGYFSNFTQLSAVTLNNNKVTEVPYLGENMKIQSLNLKMNKIASIASNAFEGLCSLTLLNLDRNRLQSISFTTLTTVQNLYLQSNNILNVVEGDFPLTNGSLTNVKLDGNPFECNQKMCFTLIGPWASIFELDSNPCSTPSDLTGKSKTEAAHSLYCPDEACYHVPVIPNASSEVMSKYVWYTCNNGLLFADGLQRKRLLCESANLSADDIVSAGCKGGIGIRKRKFVQNGVESYSDEESIVIGKTARVEEYMIAAPNTLSCARVCSRLADCTGYKVVYPEGGSKGKCEVNIVQA